ncbi:hypothetical protein DVH24_018314 [Malus domestica]|uniref:Non-haem dioxygenase N-terminal domain-containing protein n=1 Tax=Malus domestica TaxID=3750 RepID=A0A498KKW3_MALDO|nr:hypothetical protein DVH24_018314 [Malus domestica]
MGDGDEDCKTIPAINLQNFPDEEEYRKLREASETCMGLLQACEPQDPSGSDVRDEISLLDLPMEIKKQNKSGKDLAGSIAPSKLNPLYESLGLFDLASPRAVHSFFSQLDASSHQRDVIAKYAQATCEQVVNVGKKLTKSYGLVNNDFHKGWPCRFRMNKYNFSPESVGSTGV